VPDVGLTHLALTVTDSERSRAFYERFAGLRVVHRRCAESSSGDVLWLADGRRRFVLVLLPVKKRVEPLRGPLNHIGVACETREEVDRLSQAARDQGITIDGPHQYPPPVGYWSILHDPDGHALELSYGQDVEIASSSDEANRLS
jgi:catechol 2,3-dioxygenase-like lactoylglutathione lyase family enzyme